MKIWTFLCYFFVISFPVFQTFAQDSFFETVSSPLKLCGYAVIETSSGDILIVGSSVSDEGFYNRDALILRFNRDGKLEWKKAFGGRSIDQFRAIAETSDTGFLAAGFSESFGGAGRREIMLVKFRSNGSVQWKRLIGSGLNDAAMSLTNTSDGYVVLAGYTSDTDVLALKLDPSTGNIIWQKSYGVAGVDETGYSVTATTNGGIVIAGETRNYIPNFSNPDSYDTFILKTDTMGNLQWSRILRKSWAGVRFNAPNKSPVSVTSTADGGAVLAFNGYFNRTSTPVLVRFSSTGNRMWGKKYGDGNSVWSVKSVTDGLLVSGEMDGTKFYVFKTDLNGNTKWHRMLSADVYSSAMDSAPSADSTYFFTGCFGSRTLQPNENILPLFKLDRLGNINGSCPNFVTPQVALVAKTVSTPFSSVSFNTNSLTLQVTSSTLGEKSFGATSSTVCKDTGGGAVCGNAKCEAGETKQNCPQDCKEPDPGPVCGNDKCESGENPNTCPQDCKEPEPQCHPCYTGPGVCLPPNASDVDCGEISWEDFNACSSDPYGLDGDNDGIACES